MIYLYEKWASGMCHIDLKKTYDAIIGYIRGINASPRETTENDT